MNPIFDAFVFGEMKLSRRRAEEVIREEEKKLTSEQRKRANDALLRKLDILKKAHVDGEPWKKLLNDEYTSALVNSLVLINVPWMMMTLGGVKRGLHIKDSVEEMIGRAVAGRNSLDGDVSGMIGAILKYDYDKYGVDTFTSYLMTAMQNSFKASAREKHIRDVIEAKTLFTGGEDEPQWTKQVMDTVMPTAHEIAINDELMSVLKELIAKLPEQESKIFGHTVQRILATGHRPLYEDVGNVVGVTRQRVNDVMHSAIKHIHELMIVHYPQLAAENGSGWKEFKKQFTIGIHEPQAGGIT